ncbi:hypothetical protein A3Q56_01977 [Intoshia linei]|uniref:Beta'-coat protein n=1 Tax=Intoshia linei TaxID=1819745 RepID=A0A177B9M8_9BILA|nr:hypothetical protein A3Q56_01977 [Intoshia linei]
MSLFDVKRKLTARSDRVKCIDIHSTEPWIVASLYNGNVHFWNYESQSMTKTLEICTVPIRAVKFVPRKNWVITGSDDLMIRVYNYINLEKIKEFEAHSDYIRSMDVHASQPLLLTCSDDQTIKLWNWDKSWECIQSFEKHSHYIMQILFNPKDNNTFASASLDKTIKVWHLGSRNPNFSLEGHTRGVNTISYYHGPDKPYIISGSDDFTAKIWDYHNKSCVHTISGHVQNISAVYFHSELPVIITGSEDGTVKLWNSRTYRMEKTLNYGMDRIWTIAGRKNINEICMGFDSGTIVVKMGQENPMLSMDSNGKVVCCKNNDILQSHIKVSDSTKFEDGQLVDLSSKNIGTCEIYPHFFKHNSNGRKLNTPIDGNVSGKYENNEKIYVQVKNQSKVLFIQTLVYIFTQIPLFLYVAISHMNSFDWGMIVMLKSAISVFTLSLIFPFAFCIILIISEDFKFGYYKVLYLANSNLKVAEYQKNETII